MLTKESDRKTNHFRVYLTAEEMHLIDCLRGDEKRATFLIQLVQKVLREVLPPSEPTASLADQF